MRDDTVLIAIDEGLGASDRCSCGKEFHLARHGDTLWLECPDFAGRTLLPARVAAFIRELSHDRRPVAALPCRPAGSPPATARTAHAPRPVAVRG